MGFTGFDGNRLGSQIMVCPNTMREEAAWYITNNELPFYYFSPAYLFYKPKVLLKGEELSLQYRINHFRGETQKTKLEDKYQNYKKEKTNKPWQAKNYREENLFGIHPLAQVGLSLHQHC